VRRSTLLLRRFIHLLALAVARGGALAGRRLARGARRDGEGREWPRRRMYAGALPVRRWCVPAPFRPSPLPAPEFAPTGCPPRRARPHVAAATHASGRPARSSIVGAGAVLGLALAVATAFTAAASSRGIRVCSGATPVTAVPAVAPASGRPLHP
jgi:hypothetical protein